MKNQLSLVNTACMQYIKKLNEHEVINISSHLKRFLSYIKTIVPPKQNVNPKGFI